MKKFTAPPHKIYGGFFMDFSILKNRFDKIYGGFFMDFSILKNRFEKIYGGFFVDYWMPTNFIGESVWWIFFLIQNRYKKKITEKYVGIFYGFIGGLIFGRKKYGGFFNDSFRPEIRSGKIYGGYFMDYLILFIQVFMGH